MPVSFSWRHVNPDGSSEWTCPHCNIQFCTSRTHYYQHHHNGQCQLAAQHPGVQQESADGYVDDSGEQHTGAAAVYAREHDEAVAEFQQLCLDAGLSHEQLLALQPGFLLLGNPFRQLLEQLPADDDATPEAEGEDDIQEQSEALHQRLQGQLCAGESQAGALEAWVRIFDWRCRHHIKVSPASCTRVVLQCLGCVSCWCVPGAVGTFCYWGSPALHADLQLLPPPSQ